MADFSLIRRFSAPRYWSAWIGVGFGRLIARLPMTMQLAIGGFLGRLFGRLNRYRRHVADVNLALCFPELSAEERGSASRQAFCRRRHGFFEMATAWWAPDDKVRPLGWVEGWNILKRHWQKAKA